MFCEEMLLKFERMGKALLADLAHVFAIYLLVLDVLGLDVAVCNLDVSGQVVLLLVGFSALVTTVLLNSLLLL
jgi:hypothetical protein